LARKANVWCRAEWSPALPQVCSNHASADVSVKPHARH
jgi:hypothetical protein